MANTVLNLSGYDSAALGMFHVHGVSDPMNMALLQKLSPRRGIASRAELDEWATQVAHLAKVELWGEENPRALIGGIKDCFTAVLPAALRAEGITPMCLIQNGHWVGMVEV